MPDVNDFVRDLGLTTTRAGTATAAPLPPPFPGGSAAVVLPDPNEHARIAGVPCISLAGKDWPIPLLAPRQNRVVVPAVTKVTKRMREIAERKLAEVTPEQRAALVEELGSEGELRKRIWKITDFSAALIAELEPEFFDTIADAVYWALTRAHPQMTRQAFDNTPIGTMEMIDAIGIVAEQTGMMRKADPSGAPLAQPGEAAANPNSPTGMASSPTSATG